MKFQKEKRTTGEFKVAGGLDLWVKKGRGLFVGVGQEGKIATSQKKKEVSHHQREKGEERWKKKLNH